MSCCLRGHSRSPGVFQSNSAGMALYFAGRHIHCCCGQSSVLHNRSTVLGPQNQPGLRPPTPQAAAGGFRRNCGKTLHGFRASRRASSGSRVPYPSTAVRGFGKFDLLFAQLGKIWQTDFGKIDLSAQLVLGHLTAIGRCWCTGVQDDPATRVVWFWCPARSSEKRSTVLIHPYYSLKSWIDPVPSEPLYNELTFGG